MNMIDELISAKAYDLMEDGATYSATDFAALRAQATEIVFSLDEPNLQGAARAAECARLRDFRDAAVTTLRNDHAGRGHAWPFSGDHLNTIDVREELLNGEQGDVIGRERRGSASVNIWANPNVLEGVSA